MKYLVGTVALIALAACEPTVPDSGAGVGFGDSTDNNLQAQRANRDALLEGRPLPSNTDRVEGVTIVDNIGPADTVGAPLDATVPSVPAVASANNAAPGISDEQNFDAVANRESIESDAARIAANREQYQVIQPTALPSRSEASGPNIVQYALSTTNTVGQQLYRRSAFSTENKFLRNCSKYASADQAQQDFLARGGPQKDRQGLDPDGDGFACGWNPAPYRLVRN